MWVTVRGLMRSRETAAFDELLDANGSAASPHPPRILLAVDGSPSSVAAVQEVARCRLPKGSAVRVLTAIHSRVPVGFDPAFASAAAHADDVNEQEGRAPEIQQAAVARLRRHRPELDVTTSIVDGVPKDVILREARAWHADRIVLGSHGYGALGRTFLGSTAAEVATQAPCSVVIARPVSVVTS
ncbi:MAG TPA: universal stress protein [Vicinamibacterales bacterium]|nr:universal stress protein [Vicinamibacterales bacterium]